MNKTEWNLTLIRILSELSPKEWCRLGFAIVLIFLAVFIVTRTVGPHLKTHRFMAGNGGDGGDAKASDDAVAVGGNGGPGGGIGGGKGGDGGDVEASGQGSTAIGGDGGGGGRADGRGGKGANSPLKKLPLETLKGFGLTGNENYGSGGSGGNTQEYDRRVKVLKELGLEYSNENPGLSLNTMSGVKMPPLEWINKRLAQEKESFKVEFVEHATDFFLHSVDVDNK
ncbi:MAG: hypothetical protein ABH862_06865 [Candidatus Omnitrophota bacterium]